MNRVKSTVCHLCTQMPFTVLKCAFLPNKFCFDQILRAGLHINTVNIRFDSMFGTYAPYRIFYTYPVKS